MLNLMPEGKVQGASEAVRKHPAEETLCAKARRYKDLEGALCGWNIERWVESGESWDEGGNDLYSKCIKKP